MRLKKKIGQDLIGESHKAVGGGGAWKKAKTAASKRGTRLSKAFPIRHNH